MQLTRCSAQESKSLDEFYEELTRDGSEMTRRIGRTMLSLVKRLRELPDDRCVWGLTSHANLVFHTEDDWTSTCFVSVIGLDPTSYYVEYQMPDDQAPWEGACVRGYATSEDSALEMILIAMDKSQGWIK